MRERYIASLQDKQLNEVVIPGSHDAGIYGFGKDTVITQKQDIFNQAMSGVRWFDLRIATQKTGIGPWASYEQKAYHLKGTFVNNSGHALRSRLPGGNQNVKSHQNVAHMGGWGGDLDTILSQAKNFVKTYDTEFLILKFSKCFNLENVITACKSTLKNRWYDPGGAVNLNTQKVNSPNLKGKVITLFSGADLEKVQRKLPGGLAAHGGCVVFRELYDKKKNSSKVYESNFNGLQYFGKFSSINQIAINTQKQGEILQAGAMGADRDAMGMMYWTTTDWKGSIRERNKEMWSPNNRNSLKETWTNGLEQSIKTQMGRDYASAQRTGKIAPSGTNWKAFMPNIVMMDFASNSKCDLVHDLNTVAGNQIGAMINKFGDLLQ